RAGGAAAGSGRAGCRMRGAVGRRRAAPSAGHSGPGPGADPLSAAPVPRRVPAAVRRPDRPVPGMSARERASQVEAAVRRVRATAGRAAHVDEVAALLDRKSTRLNSSHVEISYAVFCLKKKKKKKDDIQV